jgi:hypothetical protein
MTTLPNQVMLRAGLARSETVVTVALDEAV